jgi:chaperonin GroES
MKMSLRPLGTKVIVEPAEQEDKTAGGIILPDTAKKKPVEGKVIAVGTGRTLDDGTVVPLALKVGQTVVYAKYGGNEVTVQGKEYMILDEDQIYAVKE